MSQVGLWDGGARAPASALGSRGNRTRTTHVALTLRGRSVCLALWGAHARDRMHQVSGLLPADKGGVWGVFYEGVFSRLASCRGRKKSAPKSQENEPLLQRGFARHVGPFPRVADLPEVTGWPRPQASSAPLPARPPGLPCGGGRAWGPAPRALRPRHPHGPPPSRLAHFLQGGRGRGRRGPAASVTATASDHPSPVFPVSGLGVVLVPTREVAGAVV